MLEQIADVDRDLKRGGCSRHAFGASELEQPGWFVEQAVGFVPPGGALVRRGRSRQLADAVWSVVDGCVAGPVVLDDREELPEASGKGIPDAVWSVADGCVGGPVVLGDRAELSVPPGRMKAGDPLVGDACVSVRGQAVAWC